MNVTTALGVSVIVLASAYAGVAAYAVSEPSAEAPVASYVPELTAADYGAVTNLLGRTAKDGMSNNRRVTADLTVPAGATSYREGLWHLGPHKWGMVRVYAYDQPINIPTRAWRTNRALEGAVAPKLHKDRFGVQGLREVSVYIDTKGGRVVSVQPTDYDALVDTSFEPNAAGEVEMGE